MLRSLGLLVLAACGAAHAQMFADSDWREAAAPQPPALRTTQLVPLSMPGSAMRWGVDPASISIGPDSVVRYVVVAAGEGAVTGLYEGLRCNTGEVKLYMRNMGGQWQPANGDWKPLHGNGAARHSLAVARHGACIGHGPNSSASQIARDLAASPDHRFRPEVR